MKRNQMITSRGKSCQAPGDRLDLGKALAYRKTGCHLRAAIGHRRCKLATWHSLDDVDALLLVQNDWKVLFGA